VLLSGDLLRGSGTVLGGVPSRAGAGRAIRASPRVRKDTNNNSTSGEKCARGPAEAFFDSAMASRRSGRRRPPPGSALGVGRLLCFAGFRGPLADWRMVAVADSMADWTDHRTGPPVADQLIEPVACVREKKRGLEGSIDADALLWS